MANVSEPTPIASGSALASSGLGAGSLSPLTLGLVSCGGIGALLFTATYLIEGAARPGYDAWNQPVSALSLGPGGWAQQVNFIVYGVLLALSAVGWYRVLSPRRIAFWFPLFQGISGLCLIGAGLFSMDPFPGYPPGTTLTTSTAHGTIHGILAWALMISLAAGCFSMAASLRYARVPQWREWNGYSILTGVLILTFWGAFLQGASGHVAGLTPLDGFYERLAAVSHDLWLCALTATLLVQHWRRSRPSADGARAEGAL